MTAPELSAARAVRPGAASADLRVAIGNACIGYMLASLGGCLLLLARDLQIARSELGWLSAGFGVALVVLGCTGRLLLGRGPRPLLRVSSAGMGAGALLLGVARSMLLARAGTLLIGLGAAGIVLATPGLLRGQRAAARLARVNAWSSLSGIVAPILIGFVDEFSGNGRLALLLVAPALFWLAAYDPSSADPAPNRSGSSTASASSTENASNTEDAEDAENTASVAAFEGGTRVSLGRVALGWLAVVATVCPEFAFVVWGAARLSDSGLDVAGASAAAVAFPIGMGAGRLLAPRFIERLPVVTIGSLVGIAAGLVVAAPVGPVWIALAMMLAGLGIAALYPVSLTRLVSTPGLGVSLGSALGALASGVAIVGAPLLLDSVAVRVGLRLGFLIVVPALLLVIVLGRPAASESARR